MTLRNVAFSKNQARREREAMEWWIKEEKDKYENKEVIYNNKVWIVKSVNWNSSEELFKYYLERGETDSALVYEHNIDLKC